MTSASTSDRPNSACAPTARALYEHLEHVIHDDVLQSIGVSMLQADLCRRALEAPDDQQAIPELDELMRVLRSAVDGLRHAVVDLRRAAASAPA